MLRDTERAARRLQNLDVSSRQQVSQGAASLRYVPGAVGRRPLSPPLPLSPPPFSPSPLLIPHPPHRDPCCPRALSASLPSIEEERGEEVVVGGGAAARRKIELRREGQIEFERETQELLETVLDRDKTMSSSPPTFRAQHSSSRGQSGKKRGSCRQLLVDVSKAQDVRERQGEGGRKEGGGDVERSEEALIVHLLCEREHDGGFHTRACRCVRVHVWRSCLADGTRMQTNIHVYKLHILGDTDTYACMGLTLPPYICSLYTCIFVCIRVPIYTDYINMQVMGHIYKKTYIHTCIQTTYIYAGNVRHIHSCMYTITCTYAICVCM